MLLEEHNQHPPTVSPLGLWVRRKFEKTLMQFLESGYPAVEGGALWFGPLHTQALNYSTMYIITMSSGNTLLLMVDTLFYDIESDCNLLSSLLVPLYSM